MYYLLDIVRPRVRTHTFPDRCALLGSSFFVTCSTRRRADPLNVRLFPELFGTGAKA